MLHLLLVVGCLASGLLAASKLIEERAPQVNSVLKLLSPFKIYIGAITLVLGLFGLLGGRDVLTGVAAIAVGAVLAVSLLSYIPSLKDETREKISTTLGSYQNLVGVIAVVVGVIALLFGWGENTLF